MVQDLPTSHESSHVTAEFHVPMNHNSILRDSAPTLLLSFAKTATCTLLVCIIHCSCHSERQMATLPRKMTDW